MRRISLAIILFLAAASSAFSQGCGTSNPSCIVATAPLGTSNNQAASTAFVQNALAGSLILQNGKIFVGNASNLAIGVTPSGDLTTSNTGVFTFNTVNSNVGSFGSSTAIPTLTVNGKGLVTAVSTNAVIAPAGTLTGTTLASNVVSSSLTSAAGGPFGTAAYQNTGTSGANLPFLNGLNTWGATQTLTPSSGDAIDITTASGTTAKGFNINQHGTTSNPGADFPYNRVVITNDGLANSGFNTFGQYVELDTGGASAVGQKYAFRALADLAYSGATTGGDVVGLSGWCITNQNNGGTNTSSGAAGTCFGGEFISHLFSGATNYFVLGGVEYDAIVDSGASVANRWGISSVGNGSGNGAATDAGFELGAATSAGAYVTGWLLDNIHGFAPLQTSGCVICTDGSSNTIATGFDLSAYSMTTDWKFKGGNLLDTGQESLKLATTSKGSTITIVAPGAGNGTLVFGCGTNSGTAGLYIGAGTSTTGTRLLDNIGSGVTGC